jgi:hypothetical protein
LESLARRWNVAAYDEPLQQAAIAEGIAVLT